MWTLGIAMLDRIVTDVIEMNLKILFILEGVNVGWALPTIPWRLRYSDLSWDWLFWVQQGVRLSLTTRRRNLVRTLEMCAGLMVGSAHPTTA